MPAKMGKLREAPTTTLEEKMRELEEKMERMKRNMKLARNMVSSVQAGQSSARVTV